MVSNQNDGVLAQQGKLQQKIQKEADEKHYCGSLLRTIPFNLQNGNFKLQNGKFELQCGNFKLQKAGRLLAHGRVNGKLAQIFFCQKIKTRPEFIYFSKKVKKNVKIKYG